MVFCIILVFMLITVTASQSVLNQKLCTSRICLEEAANLRRMMDTTVNPCENFYEFACGKYIKETKIAADEPFTNIFITLVKEIRKKMIALISTTHLIRPFQLLKLLYDQCMNVDAIEQRGLTSFVKVLEKLGNWPVLIGHNWKNDDYNWKQSIYTLRKLGLALEAFLHIEVDTDSSNSSLRVIAINQPSLGLNQEVLVDGLKNNIVKAYYDYMVKVAVALGANPEFAKKDLKDSLECEINIAKMSLSHEDWWNATALYNPMTIEELAKKHSSIPWMEYITNILYVDNYKITPHDIVIVKVPTYLGKLEELLKRLPKRIQANYILWRTTHNMIPFLTKDLRHKRFEFERLQNGNAAHKLRTQECYDDLSEKMDIAMGALYAREYFSDGARNIVKRIIDDLVAAFITILQSVQWIDEQTKKHALNKAASLSKYVGYPDEMLDDNALNKYYENLNLTFDDYLMTSLDIEKFLLYKHFERLRSPVNKTEWISRLSPLTINAVYSPAENSIHVPAAILQKSFFNKDRPQYMNYAAIGYVIGHEITHGFDDFGRHYDKDGQLVDWWTEGTKQAYLKKAQCFVEQYNNFSIPELQIKINGKRTLNENMADNGGIAEAYLAYQLWKKKFGSEPRLAGLNYTSEQLFWISAANIFCTHDRPEYLKSSTVTNSHAPLMFRVLGSFSNFPKFGKDFNCPQKSKMNPSNKCQIW